MLDTASFADVKMDGSDQCVFQLVVTLVHVRDSSVNYQSSEVGLRWLQLFYIVGEIRLICRNASSQYLSENRREDISLAGSKCLCFFMCGYKLDNVAQLLCVLYTLDVILCALEHFSVISFGN